MSRKKISVRNLQIFPPVALAPMVGLTHAAFRTLVQQEGGAGLFFTEMLAAKRLPHENESCSPLLKKGANDRPLIYQIFVFSNDHVAPAVEKLHEFGADGIDLNLGCPAPVLRKQGAGDSLADNPILMKKIVTNMRRLTSLPLSVKMRLGYQDNREKYLSFCRDLEDHGVDFLTIHARMNGEKFCRKPRWAEIAEVKKNISIPVFANGGIFTVKDAKRCLEESGADGLMIGRGAAIRPWLPAQISSEIYGCKTSSVRTSRTDIYSRFSRLLVENFPVERRLGRLKQFTHYFAGLYPFGHHLATSVQKSSSFEEALHSAAVFFDNASK